MMLSARAGVSSYLDGILEHTGAYRAHELLVHVALEAVHVEPHRSRMRVSPPRRLSCSLASVRSEVSRGNTGVHVRSLGLRIKDL